MNLLSTTNVCILAADATATLTSRDYEMPKTPFGWLLLLGGSTAIVLWVVWLYLRDTRELSAGWKVWLTGLRLAVLGGLLLIALNPSDRTQKQAFRPSRVAIVVDTSLSMRHPAESSTGTGTNSSPSRAEAVARLFSQTPLIEQLRKHHEVSVFTFDSRLEGPHRVYPLASTSPPPRATTGIQRNSNGKRVLIGLERNAPAQGPGNAFGRGSCGIDSSICRTNTLRYRRCQ